MNNINIFKKRPLFTACILFIAFSVIGYFSPIEVKLTVILLALATFIAAVLVRLILKKLSPYTILCITLSCGMIMTALVSSFLFFDVRAESYKNYYGKEHTIEAIVISNRYYGTSTSSYEILVTEIDGNKTIHKAILDCEYSSVLDSGYRFTAVVDAEDFGTDEFRGYTEKNSMQSDGIFINYVSPDESSVEITEEGIQLPDIWLRSINKNISLIFSTNLEENTSSMSSALLLGNKQDLAPTIRRDFTRAGASHILALSGMHMSILMGFLLLILRKLSVNNKVIAVILSVCAVSYLFITGMQISAARSVIMLLFVYLSWLLKKPADPLTSLSLSGFILILIMPGTVIDSGFWMSFAATLGILTYSGTFAKFIKDLLEPLNLSDLFKKILRKLISAVATSIFATFPLLIVLCIFIKQYSLFSIITAITLELPAAGIILFSLLFLVFSKVPLIAGILARVLYILSHFMIDFCASVSDIEGVVISLNYPFAAIAALIIGAALLHSLVSRQRNPIIALTPYVIVVSIFIGSAFVYNVYDSGAKITYVNASSNSDLLVMADSRGQAIICDIGNGSNTSYNKALDAVYDLRATEIKALVLTKYTTAHCGSLYSMFTSQKVRLLWVPRPETEEDYHLLAFIKDLADRYSVPIRVYDLGEYLNVFSFTTIMVENYYIDRSVSEIVLVEVAGRKESLVYCSPAFNECDETSLNEINNKLKRAEFIVFGNSGPKTKSFYTISSESDAEALVFSDKIRASYFVKSKKLTAERYLVSDTCKFIIEE